MLDDSTFYASCFTCAGIAVDSTSDVCDNITIYWLREVCELVGSDGFVLTRAAGSCIVSIVACDSTVYACILLWARGWFVYIASLGMWVVALIVAGSRRGYSRVAGISLVSRLYLQEHSGRWGWVDQV